MCGSAAPSPSAAAAAAAAMAPTVRTRTSGLPIDDNAMPWGDFAVEMSEGRQYCRGMAPDDLVVLADRDRASGASVVHVRRVEAADGR
ncbi:hypothetical protein GCM10027575_04840 [Phytohabitans suffuscus]